MLFVFFGLFLIFSGKVTLEIVIIGALLSLLMTFFCVKFLNYRIRRELVAIRLFPLAVAYFCVLVVEILKANIATISLIVSPKYEVEPALFTFKSGLKTELARTILANSITLTPGTITVELAEDEFTIHCLDKEFANGIANSVFVKQLLRMERTATGMKRKERRR